MELSTLVVVLVTLGNSFFSETSSLEVLLVKHALRAGKLVVQVQVLLGPINMMSNDVSYMFQSEIGMKIRYSVTVVSFDGN